MGAYTDAKTANIATIADFFHDDPDCVAGRIDTVGAEVITAVIDFRNAVARISDYGDVGAIMIIMAAFEAMDEFRTPEGAKFVASVANARGEAEGYEYKIVRRKNKEVTAIRAARAAARHAANVKFAAENPDD